MISRHKNITIVDGKCMFFLGGGGGGSYRGRKVCVGRQKRKRVTCKC